MNQSGDSWVSIIAAIAAAIGSLGAVVIGVITALRVGATNTKVEGVNRKVDGVHTLVNDRSSRQEAKIELLLSEKASAEVTRLTLASEAAKQKGIIEH